MKLLVTGGAGLIGLHVAEAAGKAGCSVRLTDVADPPAGVLERFAPEAEFARFDVRDADAGARLAAQCSAIVHCAALVGPSRCRETPLLAVAVNVQGTGNLLELARHTGLRLLHVSTATLYGNDPSLTPLDETARPDPLGVYDASKLMAETLCTAYRRTYDTDVASFRTGFVYGFGSAIGEYFLPRALKGEAIAEPNGEAHPCDFTYVVDLAEGLVSAATAPSLPEPVYNLTGGRLRTRGELAAAVRRALPSARISQGAGLAPDRHLRGPCVIERARRDFGYEPRFSLEAGIEDWLGRLRTAAPADRIEPPARPAGTHA
jgi:UDP-glucuronate 4-epimerase